MNKKCKQCGKEIDPEDGSVYTIQGFKICSAECYTKYYQSIDYDYEGGQRRDAKFIRAFYKPTENEDELFIEAALICVRNGLNPTTTTDFQKALSVGYNRSLRIIIQLGEANIGIPDSTGTSCISFIKNYTELAQALEERFY